MFPFVQNNSPLRMQHEGEKMILYEKFNKLPYALLPGLRLKIN